MKIMLVIGALSFGGAERVMTNLANYFSEQGDQVILVTIKERTPVYPLNENIVLVNGVEGSNQFKEIYNLRKVIKRTKPKIILSFLTQINIATIIAAFGLRIPVVISERNDPTKSPTQINRKLLRALFYPIAQGFVFQTDEAKDYFSSRIKNKSTVIPNPIFLGEEPTNIIDRKKEIVTIGRLVPQKKHKNIIKAFNIIRKKHPEYTLSIYGDGIEKENLQHLIKEYDLEEHVTLKGEVDDLHTQIKESEIFILASDYEGMPNALMEAMALGLACISTDSPSGGSRFLINDNNNGLLIPVDNVESIVKSIIYLIKNPKKRISISQKALNIYSDLKPNKINNLWREYLHKIIYKY